MAKRLVWATLAVLLMGTLTAAAQIREVEVFYDRYGRQILLDTYTGEVVEIREPRGGDLRSPGDVYEEPAMRREQRMRELGRVPPRQRHDYRDYGGWDEPAYRDDDYYFDGYEDDFAREPAYPGPEDGQPDYRDPSVPGHRESVDRRPLDDNPAVAGIPGQLPPGGQLPGDVTGDGVPPQTVIPDVRDHPQIGHGAPAEDVAKIQILLDRAGASPGVIDGRMGDNVNKAIGAYRDLTGETLRTYDKDYVEAQLRATGGDAFITYEITAQDVATPFVASIPQDYAEKAQMERLSFTSVTEMLAERFHMDERYLRSLNPGIDFNRPGTRIKVANVKRTRAGEVMRIVADKSRKQVRAYDGAGRLVVAYPATIGSAATPSPTGTHTVERIALDPEYTYNPRVNFQQGNNTRVLTIPPGPNGPVGTVWIGLSKPTYGIHGTPEPSQIGKTESNGCIRLTNWDAQELAKLVKVGATVEFAE